LIEVGFGPRKTVGVVWRVHNNDDNVPENKLKHVSKHLEHCPSLTENNRKFIDWMASYTMSPLGLVLKMAMTIPEAFLKEKPDIFYRKAGHDTEGKLSAARKRVLAVLEDGNSYPVKDLAAAAECGVSVIKTMAEKQMLLAEEISPPAPCISPRYSGVSLSKEQSKAAADLVTQVETGQHNVTLLDGVTGSGKTEVYFETIACILEQDETAQVAVLLPEIALSKQFFDRFVDRFGEAPAVWHSGIPKAQRRKAWRGVAEGKTRVVVGARSALFLPYQNLSLLILDEEHDPSYKQEDGGPIYHARDMAIVRGKIESCPVILVSATPSLETMVNVKQGKYHSVALKGRFGSAVLPEVHMIDMKKNPPPERASFVSAPLRKALKETLEAGEQSLLFLNRRGYAPLTLCRTCGHRLQCPSCTAWLVKHRKFNRLQCHHCGYGCTLPEKCPECEDEESLAFCGPGVERLEEEVHRFLPEARTLLLSSDLLTSETALIAALDQVHKHEIDIIIGTQLVAKGHHFPLLTCVGVVDADLGLEGGDLRAAERTYQLLHQVSGRAGRAEKTGYVYLQSYQPENPVMQALMEEGRDTFLDVESNMRHQAGMPPFGRLAGLVLASQNEAALDQFCNGLARIAPRYEDVMILGPAPAPLAMIRGQHRRRFLIKAQRTTHIQKLIEQWLEPVTVPRNIKLKIDIDPYSFL